MRTLIATLILALAGPLMAARLEFVGLRSYTPKALKEAIAGRLDYISKRKATSFRADDAAFLVETYLHTHGLPDAAVTWALGQNNTIILTVDERLPKFLGPITIEGYEDIEAAQEQFKAPFPEFDKKRAFNASAIDEGIERVISLLRSEGYWTASLQSSQGARSPEGEIPFTLKITPGTLLTLAVPILTSPVPPTPALNQKLPQVKNLPSVLSKLLD